MSETLEVRAITGKPVRCSNRQCPNTADVRITAGPTLMNYCKACLADFKARNQISAGSPIAASQANQPQEK